jgi:hypothetical protein
VQVLKVRENNGGYAMTNPIIPVDHPASTKFTDATLAALLCALRERILHMDRAGELMDALRQVRDPKSVFNGVNSVETTLTKAMSHLLKDTRTVISPQTSWLPVELGLIRLIQAEEDLPATQTLSLEHGARDLFRFAQGSNANWSHPAIRRLALAPGLFTAELLEQTVGEQPMTFKTSAVLALVLGAIYSCASLLGEPSDENFERMEEVSSDCLFAARELAIGQGQSEEIQSAIGEAHEFLGESWPAVQSCEEMYPGLCAGYTEAFATLSGFVAKN